MEHGIFEPLEDDLLSLAHADHNYRGSENQHASREQRTVRGPTDVSGQYSGQDQIMDPASSHSCLAVTIPSERHGSFHSPIFDDRGDLCSVQVAQTEFSLSVTVQVPHIALETPGMIFDLGMDASNTP